EGPSLGKFGPVRQHAKRYRWSRFQLGARCYQSRAGPAKGYESLHAAESIGMRSGSQKTLRRRAGNGGHPQTGDTEHARIQERSMRRFKRPTIALFAVSTCLFAADPIFLRRQASDVLPQPDDLTANAKQASYRPLFGIGDPDAGQLQGVARYGEP